MGLYEWQSAAPGADDDCRNHHVDRDRRNFATKRSKENCMTDVHSRLRACIVLTTTLAACPAFADVPITAVPPADYRSGTAQKAAPLKMQLPRTAPSSRIALPQATPAERAALKSKNAQKSAGGSKSNSSKAALAVAFPRSMPAGSETIGLGSLAWQALADGSHAARIEIVSPGAAALRVALRLAPTDPGVTLGFSGNGVHAQVFAVPANAVAADTQRFGQFWSPVLEGEVATIEIHVEAGVRAPDSALTITRLSHQVVAPAMMSTLDTKAAQDIGMAGACNIDVACVTPQTQAFVDSTRSVAAAEMTQEDGFTYLCTGTLLNDSLSSNTPYLFSAAHCLDSAMAARTLNTFWFFDAIACGSKAVPPYVQQASGASMLARSPDWDWALVRLNAPPPAGSKFAAWRAEPIPTGATVSVLHHPEGDLKKWSQGSTLGYQLYTDNTSFAQVRYTEGTTEPGSSGAGLLTFLDNGGYYEVRGGLWSGLASCAAPAAVDQYSRLDNMLPLTRQYLTPNTPGTPGQMVAVEFYNRELDHYFITISPGEINDLDTGVHGGWQRTGLSFLAYQNPTGGTEPVCRFYRTPGFGNSHFYSASASECQTVIANPQTYPGWTFESPNVFYIALPDPITGACAAGTKPIWRFYNQRTINHRYTADQTVRDDMRSDPATWQREGYGPDSVIMCAPVGS
jgi:lysyl endopeptidase